MNALSNEITIGTSAPPTGSTSKIPSTRDSPSSNQSKELIGFRISAIAVTTVPTATPIVMKRPSGITTGREVINSCNFANVKSEPVNETEPTTTVKIDAVSIATLSSCTDKNSITEITAAAPPPTPLNNATICGICVICTRRAAIQPMIEPIAIAIKISGKC
ncbi:unannotated protein [freshwater metagenome]|uniref:Unannotated protein n=1 Tax=freshwater metagenome TaxID=449393 RepID=A0A6J6UCH4_9ZZZZ